MDRVETMTATIDRPMLRRCTRCGDLDQTVPVSFYPATAPCCPVCHNPEFSNPTEQPQTMPTTTKTVAVKPTKNQEPRTKNPTVKKHKVSFDPATFTSPQEKTPDRLEYLPLDILDPDPHNPRSDAEIIADPATAELADSIKAHGLAQPLVVRPEVDRYKVIIGHRRRIASQLAGLKYVPCLVRQSHNLVDEVALQLVENLQRQDLNPIQEAHALARALEVLPLTQSELGATIGKSQGHIGNRLRLLALPDWIQDHLKSNILTVTQARDIAPFADHPDIMQDLREFLAQDIADAGLTDPPAFPLDRLTVQEALRPAVGNHAAYFHENHHEGPRFKPTPEQLAALDIRELQEGHQTHRFALNLDLYRELQATADRQRHNRPAAAYPEPAEPQSSPHAPREEAPQGAKPDARPTESTANQEPSTKNHEHEVQPLTQFEEEQRQARIAATFNKKLYRYKITWLKHAIAPRLGDLNPDLMLRLAVGFATIHHDTDRDRRWSQARTIAAPKWKPKHTAATDGTRWLNLLNMKDEQFAETFEQWLTLWCELDSRSFSSDSPPELVEALADILDINLNKQWKPDADFLDLLTTDQLTDLAGKWWVTIPEGTKATKTNLVKLILDHTADVTPQPPPFLKQCQPVDLD